MTSRNASPKSASLWSATGTTSALGPLHDDAHADVVIVGAGIAGLSTAYLLAQTGKAVLVLDDGPIGGGVTQLTSAHLSYWIDDGYHNLGRTRGEDIARIAAESHRSAIDRIESIVRTENIACDFARVDGHLFVPPDGDPAELDEELAAAHSAGLAAVEKLPRAPLDFDTGPCLRFPNCGQFHPLKYLAGLAEAVVRSGGRIFTDTHADAIEGGETCRVKIGNHAITANAVVVATNTPINDMVAIHTKQAPYMTYVIGVRVPHGSVTPGLYWDTADPYHYVRVAPAPKPGEDDVLIVGGEDHKTGQADDTGERYTRLEQWARVRFPKMGEVTFTWCGQVMETLDGLGYIGKNPLDASRVFIATGDSGMGLTHGTIAGMLLAELINGNEHPWAQAYDPSRKPLGGTGKYAKENLNVAAQYTDWVTPGEISDPRELPVGSGAILRRGASKLAVYRAADGTVHERSATCPHLGCIVRWNPTEATWDCPCHGSRFTDTGQCFHGPANSDLSAAEDSPASAATRRS